MGIGYNQGMEITLNGEKKAVKAVNVKELIAELGLAGRPVAVERNRKVVPRKAHSDTTLQPGDAIELVTLVGGG